MNILGIGFLSESSAALVNNEGILIDYYREEVLSRIKGDKCFPKRSINRILEINTKRPIDAIIPCLDLEVETYSRLSRQLERNGIKTFHVKENDEAPKRKKKFHLISYLYRNLIS